MAGEGDGFGFHEGITYCLPSRRVLDQVQNIQQVKNREDHIHRFKTPSENFPKLQQQHPKSSLRSKNNNTRPTTRPTPTNWALSGGGGGHGMQALFLDSSHKSSGGTGVFLPRGVVVKDNLPSKKPACSPVLLPSRVVQAINLNVHDLGLQISPRQDQKNIAKSRDHSSSNNHNKIGKDNSVSSPRSRVISQKQSASPEIFLPKEWTY